MSNTSEPFAKVDPGDYDECEYPRLTVAGHEFHAHEDLDHEQMIEDLTKTANDFNAAVAAREREAAAAEGRR